MTALGLLSLRDLLPAWVLAAWLGIAVLLPLFVLLVASLRRTGKVRAVPKFSPMPPAMLPRELTLHGQPWIGRLGYLGHQVVQILRPEGDDAPDSVIWLMPNSKERTLALLSGTLPPKGGRPGFSLRLMTFLADGRVIVTADHPVTHRTPAHWALIQRPFPTIEEQLQVHRSQVETLAGEVPAVLPFAAEVIERLTAEEQAVNEALLNSGDYRTSGEQEIRPTLFRAPSMVLRDFFMRREGFHASSTNKKDVATVRKDTASGDEELGASGGILKLSLEEEVEQDIRRYRKHADQPAGMGHVFLRLMLLGATLFAFTAAFGRENPALTVGMLLGLILVHEFGHWLMMKIFGYRRMGRFFVPFVGPIDRGQKLNAPAWQQLLVILAGPLPGLVAGLAVLIAAFFLPGLPMWLRDLSGLAIALNAFHLLPFLPLDGGKVVDLLIFRDLPYLRPLFTIASAAATLVASIPLKSRALRIIGIGMFTGLAWDIRMIKVARGGRRLDWAGTVDDEHEALQRIFRGVREEENEAFLRSSGWERQIDVLLSEVLRKRPKFVTRIFGGAVYWWASMLPVAIIAGLFMMKFVGSTGQLNALAKNVVEFREGYPAEERPLTEAQYDAVTGLVAITREATNGSKKSPQEMVALLNPDVITGLDKLDWTAAGIALHGGEVDPTTLAVWLETLCGKLEAAVRKGDHTEALRRVELLLHGINAMEPASLLAEREPLWDAQIRSLAAVEQLAASGKLDAATIQRLEARVNALNKAPRPEVESLLLVDGWGRRQAEAAFVAPKPADGPEPSFDARFWRLANPQSLRFFDNIKAFADSTPATVALGRHWKKTGRVGELPPELEAGTEVHPAPGEAEFIADFCEKHRRISWRRMTTICALRMETYRLKNGKLPDRWKHSIPGGAELSLVESAGPCLQLKDKRAAIMPLVPKWLGPLEITTDADYLCPLN
ncbi:site-2 protease family protein [Luteolibacter arcticus]|uniref:Site-2 protease family protein n=1 Tax=Luteolibacter arcticus TaxID=1581411 RepID=A0ABT3GQP5_9BACT|nr:site-2 protease family protein [Luteolibacter arcticus]MCW1925849.1 site-2 protease family protein [Luteolibacter arcticus]